MAFLEPKTVTITTSGGKSKDFVISKFPAIQGREIISKYPVVNAPKIGDYAVSEETMMKVMAFCGVELSAGNVAPLATAAMVNQHCDGGWEMLIRLEWEALKYNCDFFTNASSFDFLKVIGPKLQAWITPMLTALSAQSLAPGQATGERPLTN